MTAVHNIPPVYDASSRILILGSFPSVKSREQAFFYAHPQNRFWKVLASVLGCEVPQSIEEKRKMLLENGIALWDVIRSCEISGSSDSSIRNAVPNPIPQLLRDAPIEAIFCNGALSDSLYRRYIQPETNMEPVRMPSTSPANAAWTLERLSAAWREAILPLLEKPFSALYEGKNGFPPYGG